MKVNFSSSGLAGIVSLVSHENPLGWITADKLGYGGGEVLNFPTWMHVSFVKVRWGRFGCEPRAAEAKEGDSLDPVPSLRDDLESRLSLQQGGEADLAAG